jgi:enoyl-CoA hydratase
MTQPQASLLFRDHVAVITLNCPEKHNRLSLAMVRELDQHIDSILERGDIRVLVLTGAGSRAFCAGGDLEDMPLDAAQAKLVLSELAGPVRRIDGMEIPVIAAVNGLAFGGGCGLALVSDFVLAAPHATFALPDSKLGILPISGLIRAAWRVGPARATSWMLSGESIDAEDAKRVGLVDEIVDSGGLMARALSLAEMLMLRSPLAIARIKRRMRLTWGRGDWESAFAELEPLIDSDDFREGIEAFREHREPKFNGR